MTEEQWDQLIAVHLKGSFACAKYASAQMRDQRYGRLIFCSSESGWGGNASSWQANYAAAKGGIYGLTLGLALELQPYNIRSNCILPRAATRMNDVGRHQQAGIAKGVRVPFGRQQVEGSIRDPANVAPVCVYLASEEGGWVSGYGFWAWGHQITLMARPHTQHTLFWNGPWDIDAMFPRFKQAFEAHVRPVPLLADDGSGSILGTHAELDAYDRPITR